MRYRVHAFDLRLRPCRTRIPFRFGIATLTTAPLALLRIEIEAEDGQRAHGYASDLLVPKWFEKIPDQPVETDVRRLIASVKEAGTVMVDATSAPRSVFDAWWTTYEQCVSSADCARIPALVRGFGVALVERALMDAACRASDCSFHQALSQDLFGLDLSRFEASLADVNPVAANPQLSMHLRHTIGLLDPIETSEITADDRVNDGLPQSLEEDISRYGLRYFKVKVNGDLQADIERLTRIQRVLATHCPHAPKFTLDGNEQFNSIADVVTMFERIDADPALQSMFEGMMYLEQPLSRMHTFDPDRNSGLDKLAKWTRVIIDEADAGIDAFPRAAALGYAGVSIKNCKGVFRAIANAARCRLHDGWFQSGEDLTNLPCIALQQDLLTMSALGMTHVERNGHHYFNGLGHLPVPDASAALSQHPDLYEADPQAIARLRISDGMLNFASLATTGYGDDTPVAWDAWSPADSWTGFEAPST